MDDPERMSSRLGHKVCMGAPQNVAGQWIIICNEDETWPTQKMFRVVECMDTCWHPSCPLRSIKILGEIVTGEFAITWWVSLLSTCLVTISDVNTGKSFRDRTV